MSFELRPIRSEEFPAFARANAVGFGVHATEEEIEFLKTLNFRGRRPAALYYYRELQNLRDPLHFPAAAQPKEQTKASG